MITKQPEQPGIHIAVFDNRLDWIKKAAVSELGAGLAFTEGAAWHPDGYFLFSDTPANCIYSLDPGGKPAVYLQNSGWSGQDRDALSEQLGSNGLKAATNGDLIICQHGNHAMAMLDKKGVLSSLVSTYRGKRFNSPNDLAIHSDGTIFFTDPPYGLKDQVLEPGSFQHVAGIYSFSEAGIRLVDATLQYPNGLFFSPDEQHLFVSSNHPADPGIVRYKLSAAGDYRYDGVWVRQHADGMALDGHGFAWIATDQGVMVLSATGKKMALIHLPFTPSNCCWGGMHGEQLLVTAREKVYLLSKK